MEENPTPVEVGNGWYLVDPINSHSFFGSINGAWTVQVLAPLVLPPSPHRGRTVERVTVSSESPRSRLAKRAVSDPRWTFFRHCHDAIPMDVWWKIGGFPKMMGFPPKSPILIGDFSIINHPFLGFPTNLRKHPISYMKSHQKINLCDPQTV